MFLPEPNVRIWLYTQPVDMRKSFDGLSALVVSQLQDDPASGQLFVFINRRKTHLKILYFDGAGFCIWFKRLEQGQFNYRASGADKKILSWAHLKLLLDGLEVKKIRQYKRYIHAA
ncbi:MAG: IS66 family insertion sequence hypothetical protein [Pseudomonadales bacterium]|nr:IS66 family insertion sequence hypothetical protein [Pseudomonadales bacterium]MDY6842073.1 IS66 family insertion sequence element accessory protein TnpB [Pseudomonadota bacterium]